MAFIEPLDLIERQYAPERRRGYAPLRWARVYAKQCFARAYALLREARENVPQRGTRGGAIKFINLIALRINNQLSVFCNPYVFAHSFPNEHRNWVIINQRKSSEQ